MSTRQRFLFFLLLCCGIWLRLRHFWETPTLVAEEGTVFFAGFLNHQWIWVSAGYLNALTTTVIQLGARMWPEELPRLCLTIAILLQAASVLWFTRRAWNALLPLPWRLVCCALWCWAQPIPEGTGVLLYSFWFLGLGTFFIFFELLLLEAKFNSDSRFLIFLTALWVCVATLSGPVASQLVAVLLLLHGSRCFLQKTHLRRALANCLHPLLVFPQHRILTSTWLLGSGVQAISLMMHPSHSDSALRWLPLALVNQLTMRVTLPWIIPHAWMAFLNLKVPLWICHLLALGLFVGFFQKRQPLWHRTLGFILLLINASTLLGRPNIVHILAISGGSKTISFDASRYSLMASSLCLPILISGLIHGEQKLLQKFRALVIGIFIVATALTNFPLWGEPTARPAPYPWKQAWSKIRQRQTGEEFLIPIVPEGTSLLLKSPASSANSAK